MEQQPNPVPGQATGSTPPTPGQATAATPPPGAHDDVAALRAELERLKAANADLIAQRAAGKRGFAPPPDGGTRPVGDGEQADEPARPKRAADAVADFIARQERKEKMSALMSAFSAAGGIPERASELRRYDDVWGSRVKLDENGIVTGAQEAMHALRGIAPWLFGDAPSSPASAASGKAPAAATLNNLKPGDLTALAKSDPKALDSVLAQLGHKPKSGMRL